MNYFFSKVRQRFGHNNNPNVLEFWTALKQLLLRNLETASYATNCVTLDTSSESVFEIRWKKRKSENINEDDKKMLLHNVHLGNDTVNVFKDNILYNICGFTVRNIFKKVDCSACIL